MYLKFLVSVRLLKKRSVAIVVDVFLKKKCTSLFRWLEDEYR